MKLVSNPCADNDCAQCTINTCGHICHQNLSTPEPAPIHNDGIPIPEAIH